MPVMLDRIFTVAILSFIYAIIDIGVKLIDKRKGDYVNEKSRNCDFSNHFNY